MDDSYKRKLSAYERRKINSQKIAQVQFEPKYHQSPEQMNKAYEYAKRKHEQFEKDTERIWKEPKTVWTPKDQVNEEELWDE